MCVTVEPFVSLLPNSEPETDNCGNRGLYIPNEDRYPAHFRGMGIRIEDSICVQEDHPLVLTTEAVKEV